MTTLRVHTPPPRFWLLLVTLMALSLPRRAGGDEPAPIHPGDNAAAAAAASDAAPPAPIQDIFDVLDANHDGRMDRAEFHQAIDQFEDFLRHHPQVERSRWWAKPAAGSVPHKDLGFWNGFTSAVAMIVATEIGDKTFFIAAVLSMKQDRKCVFGGAILALVLMTVLSTLMGLLLPTFLDRKYTHLLAGVLFGYFGLRLLYDSRSMASNKVSEELEEVEEEILHQRNKKRGEAGGGSATSNLDDSCTSADEGNNSTEDDGNTNNNSITSKVDVENPMRNRGGATTASGNNVFATPTSKPSKKKQHHRKHHRLHGSRHQPWHMLILQSFTLTFVAEWGDRSQIATIALAAAKNPYGVTIGGCIGHCLCTGLAVLGGRMLAARISEKTVSQWGGGLFLLFGIHSLFFES